MTTVAELKKEQVDDLDMTLSITLKVRQWKHLTEELRLSQRNPGWTGTKADFIDGVEDSIKGMLDKMTNQFEKP